MRTLEFGLGTTLTKILETLKNIEDEEVTILLPKESTLLQNPLNLKILEKESEILNKKIQFAEGLILPSAQTEVVEDTRVSIPVPSQAFKQPLSLGKSDFPLGKKPFWKSTPFILGSLTTAFLVFFLGGGYLFLQNIPTAKVTLYLDSQSIEKEIAVSGSPTITAIDVEKQTIPLTVLTTTKIGTSSAKTTGRKTVGKKASGRVTARNYNTVSEKSFPKGTILKGTGQVEGLKYTLDQAITIPKSSSSSRIDTSGKKINETDPGKVDVDITATEIGASYNAPIHHQFAVAGEGFENVNAVTFSGIAGGESSEVDAVSENDVRDLTEKVNKELENKAKEEFLTKLDENQEFIEKSFDIKPSKKQFSKQVGEEAKEFSLNMEALITGLTYNENDLKDLMIKSIENNLGDGYQLSDGSEIKAEVLRTAGKEVSLLARLKGTMLTKVSKDEIIANLKNRPVTSAENYLRGQSNIAGFEIMLVPTLPGPLNRMPANQNRIRVEMQKKAS